MLLRIMIDPQHTQLRLEDMLADLHYARKHDQLGRLALLAYCEVKGWARLTNKPDLADTVLRMFSESPCVNKDEFLQGIDNLIATLELHNQEYTRKSARIAAPLSVDSAAEMHQ